MSSYKKIRETYDEAASEYDAIIAGATYAVPPWFDENFPAQLGTGRRVFWDFACATGNIGALLKEKNPAAEIYGADLSPKMVEQARKKNIYREVRVQNLDENLRELNFPDFDLVTAFAFFEFLEKLPELLAYLHERAKPGACVLCSFQEFEAGNPDKPKKTGETSPEHFIHHAYSRAEAEELFARAGFKVVATKSVVGYIARMSRWPCPYLLVKALKA